LGWPLFKKLKGGFFYLDFYFIKVAVWGGLDAYKLIFLIYKINIKYN